MFCCFYTQSHRYGHRVGGKLELNKVRVCKKRSGIQDVIITSNQKFKLGKKKGWEKVRDQQTGSTDRVKELLE